jgi:hypothetical protein
VPAAWNKFRTEREVGHGCLGRRLPTE